MLDAVTRADLKLEIDRRTRGRLSHSGRLNVEARLFAVRFQCSAVALHSGNRCKFNALDDSLYCKIHQDTGFV